MMRAHSKPIAGLAYLVLLAVLIAISIKAFQKELPWQGGAMVTLRTTTPGLELNPHSDVKFQGLRIGEVRKITSDGKAATVVMALDENHLALLPANVDAAIVPKTLFGEKFVDLRLPTSPEAARIVPGSQIRQSTTSVEIGAVFAKLVPILDALDPAQLSVVLNSLSQALDGRGATLARSLNQLTSFLGKVEPHLGTLTEDLGQLAKTADLYNASAPDLLRVLSSTAALSRELLVPQEKKFATFLDQVGATTGKTEQVLAENADNLIQITGRSRPVLELLDEYSTAVPCFLKGLHTVDTQGTQAIGSRGPFSNLVLEVVTAAEPYKNSEDLPSSAGSDANNKNLPSIVRDWKPYCPQFSAEVLALKPAAPNSQTLQGSAIDPPSAPVQRPLQRSVVPADAVQEARTALARVLAARSLGIDQDQVPGYADLLVAPLLSDGTVNVR